MKKVKFPVGSKVSRKVHNYEQYEKPRQGIVLRNYLRNTKLFGCVFKI